MAKIPSISDNDSSARGYAEFVDGIPAAIYRTTLEGKIVYCNRAFANLLGFDAAHELIDSQIIERYYNKKDRGSLIHSILQRGRLFDLPIELKTKSGASLLCAVTAQAVVDDDGMVVHLDGLLRDISGQREHNIDQKFQGVLEMAGGVAHSLNQPLTIINNLLNELLVQLQLDEALSPKLLKMHDQINKMNEIVKKIGSIKKYESMDYVAGIKIVDIEKASWVREKDRS